MNLKTYRWIPVIAGIAIQLCLGTAYIWGVFQPEVVKALHWNNQNAALTFALLLGILTFGSTLGGILQDKYSPKPVVMGGGILMGLGFFLTSFVTDQAPWVMWITYGVIGGFGMGMIYTTVIAVCQKWFPDKRGLITGIIVSALGFGGPIFTGLATSLIKTVGVMQTFAWIAAIFVIVSVIGALFIKNPPAGYKPEGWVPAVKKASDAHVQDLKPKQVLCTAQYYIIVIAFMAATAAGLMVIPFAKVLGMDAGLTPAVATQGVTIITLFNSFGRLFWGGVSDKLGRKNTILLLMIIAGISILFVAAAESYWVLVLIGVVGFSYGGFLGVFPALTADYFGTKNAGTNYGMVLLGFGIGAVISSLLAGYFRDTVKDFATPFIIASIASFAGAVIMFFLKHPKLIEEKKE